MMPVRGKRRLYCTFLSALAFLSHDAESFCSNVKIRRLSVAPSAVQLHSSLQEDEYCPQKPPVSDFAVAATATGTTTTTSNSRFFDNIFKFDKQRFTKLGVAFAVTYNIISNLNGAITLSVAWYVASKRTGLSPLAVGQWRSLVTAYGGLYVFVTLMRPLRFALALALTKRTEHFIEETQNRLGCTRTAAIGLKVSLGFLLWIGCAFGGISLASALSGVPI